MLEVIRIFIALLMAFLQQHAPTQQKEVEQVIEPEQSIVEQYEEESSKEKESSKEEEIIYEPSPDEIALSLPQDDYALYIPDINCKVKVHVCDTEAELDTATAQYYMDLYDVATDLRYDLAYGDAVVEAYGHRSFIADHRDQRFYGLWNLQPGAKAYIAKGSIVKKYELTTTYYAYMKYIDYPHIIAQVPVYQDKNLMLGNADLILMTCAEDWSVGGRYITYWKEIA